MERAARTLEAQGSCRSGIRRKLRRRRLETGCRNRFPVGSGTPLDPAVFQAGSLKVAHRQTARWSPTHRNSAGAEWNVTPPKGKSFYQPPQENTKRTAPAVHYPGGRDLGRTRTLMPSGPPARLRPCSQKPQGPATGKGREPGCAGSVKTDASGALFLPQKLPL